MRPKRLFRQHRSIATETPSRHYVRLSLDLRHDLAARRTTLRANSRQRSR